MSIFKKQLVVFLCLLGAMFFVACGQSEEDNTNPPVEGQTVEKDSTPTSEPKLYSDQLEYWLPEKEESVGVRIYLTAPNGIQSPILYNQDGTEAGKFEVIGEESVADAYKPAKYSINLAIDEVGSYQYYCAYTDEKGKEVQLPSISVQVLESFPDVYYDSEYASIEAVSEFCASTKYREAEHDIRKQMILGYLEELSKGDYKKGETYVNPDSIRYSAVADTITFKDAAGSLCFVKLSDPMPGSATEGSHESLPEIMTDEELNAYFESYSFDTETTHKVQGRIAFFIKYDETKDKLYEFIAERINQNTGAECVSIEPTLENMRSEMAGNIMNVIECHGGYLENENSELLPYTRISESIRAAANDPSLKEDTNHNRVIYDAEKNKIALMPDFYSHYYGRDKLLRNSITHIGSCNGVGLETKLSYHLTSAFLNAGSSAVIAHSESVYILYDAFLLLDIMDNLLNGASVRKALDVAKSKNHDNDRDFIWPYLNEKEKKEAESFPRAYNYLEGNELATLPFSEGGEGIPSLAVSSDDGYYVPGEDNREIIYYSKDKSTRNELDILQKSEGEGVINMQFYDGKLYIRGGKNFYIYDPKSDTANIAEEFSGEYIFGRTEWMVHGGSIYYIECTDAGDYWLKTADLDGNPLKEIMEIKHSNELPFTYAPVSFMIYEDSVYYVNNTPEGSQIWKAPLDGREQDLIYTGKAGDTVYLCDTNSDYLVMLLYNHKLGSDVIALPLKKGADQAIRVVEGVNISGAECVGIYNGTVLYTVVFDGLYSYDLQSGKSQKVTDQFSISFSIIDDYIYAMLPEVKYMWYSLK